MLVALFRLVYRRALGHWRLLGVVAFGVVLAAALTSATAIYSDAVRDLGLSFALHQAPRLQLGVQVLNSSQRATAAEYNQRRQAVVGSIDGYAGTRVFPSFIEYGHSATFYPTAPSSPVAADDQRPRGYFQYLDDLKDHVRLDAGELQLHSDPPADAVQPPVISVVVGKQTADAYGVHVGDRFDMHPFWHEQMAPVPVVVAGIIEPRDQSDAYWFGQTNRFAVTDTSWHTFPFFIDRQTLTDVIARYLADMDVDFTTFFFVNVDAINARNATALDQHLRTAEQVIQGRVDRTTINSELPDTLTTFRQKLFFTRLPLFALIMQVVGIILYYIVMVSTMLVDRQAGEIALLKSRGAGTWQVLTVYAIEGSVVALCGILLGPLLAAGIVKLLGPTPAFHALSGGQLLSTRVSTQAIGLAALGAVLSLLALLWPAYRASRLSIVEYKHQAARPPRQPAFLRYYVDVALIVVGGIMFYELRERGSLVTHQLFGNLQADPLLLVTPALFMVMVALLFLRLFPLVLRLVARLLGEVSGPSILIGLWHIVRTPVHYSRLILLLILVVGLGVFASGFRATLDRSYRDRAAYQAGAELHLEGIRQPVNLSAGQLESQFKQRTGAGAAVAALRSNGSYSPKLASSVDATVLAIDPAGFAGVAYWRDDFSGRSLTSITRALQQNAVDQVAGVVLPDGARAIGVWVQTPSNATGYTLAARLQDANGRVLDYAMFSGTPQLGSTAGVQPAPGDWAFYIAVLNRPGFGFGQRPGPQPPGPMRFLSLYVRSRQTQQPETVTDYFEGLQSTNDSTLRQATGGFAQGDPLGDFSDLGRFEPLPQSGSATTADAFSRAPVQHAGNPATQLTWHRGQSSSEEHGFRLRGDGRPLAVFADRDFLSQAGLHTGSVVPMHLATVDLQVQIAGTFSYFPGFTPGGTQHLLVADLSRLSAEIARVPELGDTSAPDEIWAAGGSAGPLTEAQLRSDGFSADTVLSLAAIQSAQQHDPLVAASWEGILFLSFGTILMLAALGFVVYTYLSAQARTLEFAVLRTMGLSRSQIAIVVGFEQAFVVGAGLVAGTILGLPLSQVMIGYMGITETGEKVVPPMLGSISWQAAATAYAGLGVVLVAVVAALITLYGRLSVSQALRIGEV